MKRFLIAALATFVPLSAQAGFGVTHYSSIEHSTKSPYSSSLPSGSQNQETDCGRCWNP